MLPAGCGAGTGVLAGLGAGGFAGVDDSGEVGRGVAVRCWGMGTTSLSLPLRTVVYAKYPPAATTTAPSAIARIRLEEVRFGAAVSAARVSGTPGVWSCPAPTGGAIVRGGAKAAGTPGPGGGAIGCARDGGADTAGPKGFAEYEVGAAAPHVESAGATGPDGSAGPASSAGAASPAGPAGPAGTASPAGPASPAGAACREFERRLACRPRRRLVDGGAPSSGAAGGGMAGFPAGAAPAGFLGTSQMLVGAGPADGGSAAVAAGGSSWAGSKLAGGGAP